jgi:hypothetical protein
MSNKHFSSPSISHSGPTRGEADEQRPSGLARASDTSTLSYDKGVTWVVIKNFEGNCPRVSPAGEVTDHYDLNQDYTFTVPNSFPTGNRVIFAWYVSPILVSVGRR